MGTTTLAIGGSLLYPLADLIREQRASGWTGLQKHWKDRLKYSAIIAVCWWGVLFSYHLFYKVPEAIRTEARNIKPPAMPVTMRHVPLPDFWDATTTRDKVTAAPHKALPPLIRRKAFSTVIPFAIDNFRAGIPYDSNTKDPLLLTYTTLGGVSQISTSPSFDPISGTFVTPRISDADIQTFLGHVMQYYTLRTVNEIQNPVTYTNFETGKGLSTEMYPPVSVPAESEYPNEKLFELFKKLNLQFLFVSGSNDWMWRQFKMKVPSGTQIEFVDGVDAGKTDYIVRFERVPDLLLDFRIEPTGRNKGQGTFPKYFVPAIPREIQDAYSYVFTIHVDLQWKGDRTVGQDYLEWANGLEAGLRKKLVIP
jgi:hypothetical protein